MNDRINAVLEEILTDLDVTIIRLKNASGPQGEPDAKADLKYFTAQRRAYARAQYHHLRGLVPVSSGAAWLVPSTSRGALVHRLSRQGEILVCDCEASEHGLLCVHKALVEAHELAGEHADAHDDGLETADDCGGTLPPAPVLSLVPRPRDPNDDATYAEMLAALPRAA